MWLFVKDQRDSKIALVVVFLDSWAEHRADFNLRTFSSIPTTCCSSGLTNSWVLRRWTAYAVQEKLGILLSDVCNSCLLHIVCLIISLLAPSRSLRDASPFPRRTDHLPPTHLPGSHKETCNHKPSGRSRRIAHRDWRTFACVYLHERPHSSSESRLEILAPLFLSMAILFAVGILATPGWGLRRMWPR